MSLEKEKLDRTVQRVVDLLAARKFTELEAITDSIRMRSEEMAEALDAYPGELVSKLLPSDVDVIRIDTAIEECWSVNVRLHTDRESPSDLTMSLTLVQADADEYRIELDDIHVL